MKQDEDSTLVMLGYIDGFYDTERALVVCCCRLGYMFDLHGS